VVFERDWFSPNLLTVVGQQRHSLRVRTPGVALGNLEGQRRNNLGVVRSAQGHGHD